MKITACLIVKNEEKCLARCLDSVKGVDEIVVVDTGSTDNTVEIAKRYTDKVYTDYKWNDDFAEARNHAKSKCTTEWIISIDADEQLISSVDEVREVIKNATTEKTFHVRMKSGNNFHNLGRIFRNIPEVKWVGIGHEVITPAEGHNSGIVIEYGYSPAHKLDPDRMLRIMEKAVKKENKPRDIFYLAREYFYRKNYIQAIWYYNEYLKRATWKPEIAHSYLMIAKCYWYLFRGDDARMMCSHAIRINPNFKEALEFMAELHYEPMKSRWASFARLADNTEVLFNKETKPLDMSEADINHIKNILSQYKELDVLEWGSGNSTKYFTDFLTKNSINYKWTVVEHNKEWYNKVSDWKIPNVEVIYAEQSKEEYFDIKGKFDVIIIDGRNRRKCLIKAKELLKPEGTVILHDADREYYHCGFEGYKGYFTDKGHLPRLWTGRLKERISIPRIIHQCWIGEKKPPKEMQTWKDKNPNWEYILWDEKKISELDIENKEIYDKYCKEKKYSGAINVARVEILKKYGGVYIDADSECLETIEGAYFTDWDLFTVYEADNFFVDNIRLVSNAVIGCIPNHPAMDEYIKKIGEVKEINPSWRQTGPLLWSKIEKNDYSILPPFTFLPKHHSGKTNKVNGKIYSNQFWGTTHNLYD